MTMDTTKQLVEGRGRLVHHRNAQFEFSQYGTRSREPSPHIMRDRLTRYASPSRCYKRDGDEIIPRIPQPYRTSFSAVTSPRRINIMPLKGKSQSTLSDALYNSPLRSSPPPQQTRSCDILSEPCQYIPTQAQSEAVELDSREWRNKMKHILGESKSSSCVLSDAPACSTCDNYMSCSNEVTVHGDTAAMFRHGSVEPSDDTTGNKPRTTIIQKEYIHAKNVIVDSKSHPMNDGKACDGHVEMNGKKKRSRSRLHNFAQRTRDSLKVLSGGSTTDAKKPPIKDAERQLSPEGAPQSQAPSDDKAPRLNNSITRMFCRISHISPKSLRKSGSQRSESCSRHGNSSEGSTMSSSSLHVHEAMDAKAHDATPGGATQKNKSRKPSPIRQLLRRRFSGGKSSEKNYTNGKENVPTMHQPSEQSPLPLQSVRLLKTLDDGGGATHKKTVYQAFKEKQSNQRHAVPDTKPQAVRATCSPVLVPHQVAPSSPCKSPTATELVVCPVQDVLVDATRRQHQPPCTLGVRDVAKMTKGVFLLSSMSVESIGQCSLDVHSIGSGTSLAPGTQVDSVGDGQAVSTAASKYVFNSKADDDASTKSSSEHMTVLSDTTEHLTPCNDVIIVAAAHGDTSIDGSASSGSSKRNESPVVAPTAIVIPPTAHVPTAATDLKANGVVLHQNEMTDLESDGDAVDSCHIKQNGVLPFSPHPPISPKPERRVSPRDKRDAVTVSHQQPDAIVTNGDLKKTTENVESLTPDDKCVNHEVEHVCDANGEVAPLELTNTSRTAPVTTEEEMACKDGVYFLRVMQYERDHMDSLCDVTERLLKTPIPDEVAGKMRATVGKARLLTNKKFKQFHGLCRQQMEQDSNEKFKTTPQDLEGFWDMVLLQVDEVYTMFAEIEVLRRNGWINTDETSVRSTPSVISDLGSIKSKSSGGKTKTTKPKEANSTRGTKKPSQQPSRNARDEARKRLLMAKRAGRQRKASHSETDVEIFVS